LTGWRTCFPAHSDGCWRGLSSSPSGLLCRAAHDMKAGFFQNKRVCKKEMEQPRWRHQYLQQSNLWSEIPLLLFHSMDHARQPLYSVTGDYIGCEYQEAGIIRSSLGSQLQQTIMMLKVTIIIYYNDFD
jgi:hypothetical protein